MKRAGILLYILSGFVFGLQAHTFEADTTDREVSIVDKGSTIKVRVPSAAKIAKDLVGCKFVEQSQYGYFKDVVWQIMPDEKVDVTIRKIWKEKGVYHYDLEVELTLPSRACYILSAQVGYVWRGDKWKQDYFVCERIMPKVTHLYDRFISAQVTGVMGERMLEIRNYSNVKLWVLGKVEYEFSNYVRLFSVQLPPNGAVGVGGMFFGSVSGYEIHYVERI